VDYPPGVVRRVTKAALTGALETASARAVYWKEKHAHLRRRVRQLVRSLPVDLPVPACNYRLIVAALKSGATEFIENQDEPGTSTPDTTSAP